MAALKSRDAAVSASAVRVLCGLLHNKSVDPEILSAAGETCHVINRRTVSLLPNLLVMHGSICAFIAPPAVAMCTKVLQSLLYAGLLLCGSRHCKL